MVQFPQLFLSTNKVVSLISVQTSLGSIRCLDLGPILSRYGPRAWSSVVLQIIWMLLSFFLFSCHRDLRPTRTMYLSNIKTAYNFRVEKNLETKEDCDNIEGFAEYSHNYKDERLGLTIAQATEGTDMYSFLKFKFSDYWDFMYSNTVKFRK